MATYKIRSVDGDNAESGATWALAKADIHTGPWAAGDLLTVSQSHAQSSASGTAITIATAGTLAAPTQIVCVDDSSESPAATLATASVNTTGSGAHITISGFAYVEGMVFNCGGGTNAANILLGSINASQKYKSSTFNLVSTSGTARIIVCNGDDAAQEWDGCNVKFSAALQRIQLAGGHFTWRGGALASDSVMPSVLMEPPTSAARGGTATVTDVDLSSGLSTMNLVGGSGVGAWRFVFSNMKLPANWTGRPMAATPGVRQRAELYNSISGTTWIHAYIDDPFGLIQSDTGVYRVGGAMIGSEPISMKMTTNANAKFPSHGLRSNWMERVFPGTDAEVSAFVAGASKTVSVDFVHDTAIAAGQGAGASSAFRNNDFVLEVITLDTAGAVTGTYRSTAPATVLTAAADIGASSEPFTTSGMTTPMKQRLSVTIAPQQAGRIRARIVGYAASKTINYCPKITVA